MRYQSIESRIWHDEKFCQLSPSAQRLFFYILTCPHGNLIGYFVLKEGYICSDLKVLPKDFRKDLAKLLDNGLILYDDKVSIVFIKNFLKHNRITNPNQKISAQRTLLELPKSQLIQDFIRTYETLVEVLSEGLKEVLLKPLTYSYSYSSTETDTYTAPPAVEEIPFSEILNHLNSLIKGNYKSETEATRKLIRARWSEGFRLEDFQTVHKKKCDDWIGDSKMAKFLRPETLYGNKFQSYLNQPKVNQSTSPKDENREAARIYTCAGCGMQMEAFALQIDSKRYCGNCMDERKFHD